MNISFSLTTRQIRDRTKTVTRRLGYERLLPGQKFWAVEKTMGLKKGEKIKRLALCRVISVRREPLSRITLTDIVKEGFAGMSEGDFVAFFCRSLDCHPSVTVTRIEFAYLDMLNLP